MSTEASNTPASPADRAPADGRLGVLTVGLGAVASTLIAGVELVKRGMGEPIGSLTQMGTIRLGKRTDDRSPMIKDFVPLAALDDIVFGAWDPFPDDAYVAAPARRRARGRQARRGRLRRAPRRAPDAGRVRPQVRQGHRRRATPWATIGKRAMLEAIREDINRFRDEKQVERVVMIWAA